MLVPGACRGAVAGRLCGHRGASAAGGRGRSSWRRTRRVRNTARDILERIQDEAAFRFLAASIRMGSAKMRSPKHCTRLFFGVCPIEEIAGARA